MQRCNCGSIGDLISTYEVDSVGFFASSGNWWSLGLGFLFLNEGYDSNDNVGNPRHSAEVEGNPEMALDLRDKVDGATDHEHRWKRTKAISCPSTFAFVIFTQRTNFKKAILI